LIDEIIPTFDNFEMTKRNTEIWEKVDSNWRVGVEYIFANLKNVLMENGLKEIVPTNGTKFDVNEMEAVEEVEGTEENDHKVESLVQTGYKINDKVLRPAKVRIYIKK
jgi:molecular chaperone GrpE